jgi:hypothetical protein
MVPGYVLVNEARTGSPWGPKAFAQLLTYASPSGQYDEAVRWSDRTAIMPAYDRGGTLGDVSARYRAWEGAINGHAALLWLFVAARVAAPAVGPVGHGNAEAAEELFDVGVDLAAAGGGAALLGGADVDHHRAHPLHQFGEVGQLDGLCRSRQRLHDRAERQCRGQHQR